MKIRKLTHEEAAFYGFTHVANLTFKDLNTTAALTKTIALYPESGNAPVGTVMRRAATKVITAFVGCATLGAEVGDDGDVDRILVSSDMKATAGTWKVAVPSTAPAVFNTANTLDVLFTATTNNLDQLTAGDVDIYFDVVELDNLKNGKVA